MMQQHGGLFKQQLNQTASHHWHRVPAAADVQHNRIVLRSALSVARHSHCRHWQRLQQPKSRRAKPVQRPTGVATAASGAFSAVVGLLDPAAVSAASAASFKLLFLCGVIAWMSHRHMIPANTSQVMSKVAFSVTIPAMLLASTTKTLSATQPANLLAIPAIAVAQIAMGALLGRWAAAAVEGRLLATRLLFGWRELPTRDGPTTLAGVSKMVSTASAHKAYVAKPALLPPASNIPPGLPVLIELCCSFGNTVALPLLYLMTMLPAADSSRAAGFMSLFHAASSPCLWCFGFGRVQEVGRQHEQQLHGKMPLVTGPWSSMVSLWHRLVAAATGSHDLNISGRNRAVLATEQLQLASANLLGSTSPMASQLGRTVSHSSAVQSIAHADYRHDGGTAAEQLLERCLRVLQVLQNTQLVQTLSRTINPPVVAAVTGIALGLSGAGPVLGDANAAAAFVAEHSSSPFVAWELSLLLGIVRCCWETVVMLASGTLALQSIVLAASLFTTQPNSASISKASGDRINQPAVLGDAQQAAEHQQKHGLGLAAFGRSTPNNRLSRGTVELASLGHGRSGLAQPLALSNTAVTPAAAIASSMQSVGKGGRGPLPRGTDNSVVSVTHVSARTTDDSGSASFLQQLKPQSEWEWRAMVAVAAVRFVLLPAATCMLVLDVSGAGLLPPDPTCAFVLLLQSCMPPAQNFAMMMQLQPGTASLAPATARLLLQTYTLAIIPVTLWLSVFAKLVL